VLVLAGDFDGQQASDGGKQPGEEKEIIHDPPLVRSCTRRFRSRAPARSLAQFRKDAKGLEQTGTHLRAALVFRARIPYNRAMPEHTATPPLPRQPDADILILGAGPSGMLCALTAARRAKQSKTPREILLVDQDRVPARKLRASGGGRSNCTNLNASPANYISRNPRFTAQALKFSFL